MSVMNKKWWKAAGIRAIKTVAQTAIATIGTSALLSDVNWLARGKRVCVGRSAVSADQCGRFA